MVHERGDEASLEELVEMLPGQLDVVLAEGFTESRKPGVEVCRRPVSESPFTSPGQLLAVVSHRKGDVDAPGFGFDEVDSLVDLIVDGQLIVERRAVRQRGSEC